MNLKFKYTFFQDLRWIYRTFKNRNDLKRKGLIVFYFSPTRMFYLWFKQPISLHIDVPYPITCYWISSGTWGSYTPPDKIFICPWKKEGGVYSSEDLRKVILHELFHLYYHDKIKKLDFQNREKFIQDKIRDFLLKKVSNHNMEKS